MQKAKLFFPFASQEKPGERPFCKISLLIFANDENIFRRSRANFLRSLCICILFRVCIFYFVTKNIQDNLTKNTKVPNLLQRKIYTAIVDCDINFLLRLSSMGKPVISDSSKLRHIIAHEKLANLDRANDQSAT